MRLVARACARSTAIALVAAVAFIGFVGLVIQHAHEVSETIIALWTLAKLAASVGGSFWFAAAGGALTIAVATWGICVNAKADEMDVLVPWSFNLKWIGACVVLWPTFCAAAFDAVGDHTTIYQQLALFVLLLPAPALPFCFFIAMIAPLHTAD